MGPGANPGGGPMMQGPGGPGMAGGHGGYMGQQGYGEPNKGYMNQGMYGRTTGGYAGGPGGYTGRWVFAFILLPATTVTLLLFSPVCVHVCVSSWQFVVLETPTVL